jgi:hypothetical protein
LGGGVLPAGPAVAAEIWFAPIDNLPRGNRLRNQDFPRLFDEPAAWNTRVDVFQLSPYFVTQAPEAEIRRIAEFLKRHRIAVAVGVQPAQITDECTMGEGRVRPRKNFAVFRRLKAMGLQISYLGLDEPLTFAHYKSTEPKPCGFPIQDVARRVAASVKEIREFYPDARIVDFEYPQLVPSATWVRDLDVWLREFKAATGEQMDGLAFDVNWREPWQDWVRPSIEVLRRHGVKSGMFLTIAGPGTSDDDAVKSLRQNIQAVDASRLTFDFEILSSWHNYPARSVPSSDPRTLTSVLDWHLNRRGRSR